MRPIFLRPKPSGTVFSTRKHVVQKTVAVDKMTIGNVRQGAARHRKGFR